MLAFLYVFQMTNLLLGIHKLWQMYTRWYYTKEN